MTAQSRVEEPRGPVIELSGVVKAYGDVAEHDRVPAFVAHLDLLRDAGDDPAVAEADLDEDAGQIETTDWFNR